MNQYSKIARNIAFQLHADQMYDEKNSLDYRFHLNQVISMVYNYGFIAEMIAALHDSIEDTYITEQTLMTWLVTELVNLQLVKDYSFAVSISKFVAHSVYLLSDEDGVNRKERKLKTNIKLSNIKEEYMVVLLVKIADRIANMTYSYNGDNKSKMKMYFKEFEAFRNAVYRDYLPIEIVEKLDKVYNLIRIRLNK